METGFQSSCVSRFPAKDRTASGRLLLTRGPCPGTPPLSRSRESRRGGQQGGRDEKAARGFKRFRDVLPREGLLFGGDFVSAPRTVGGTTKAAGAALSPFRDHLALGLGCSRLFFFKYISRIVSG